MYKMKLEEKLFLNKQIEEIDLLYKQFIKESYFTISGKLDNINNDVIYYNKPNLLYLETLDNINLDKLLSVSYNAPFGDMKKMETVYDERVRKAKEIYSKYIYILDNDNNFKNYMFPIKNLEDILNIDHIYIEPYKITIYNEGDFFEEHTDSCPNKNSIGTIVIGLTDDYEGGDLVLIHKKETRYHLKKFDWCFFYGNCKHKVEKVTKGIRVCATFRVYTKDNPNLYLSISDYNQEEKINELMNKVKKIKYFDEDEDMECPYVSILFELEHMYGEISPSELKGSDSILYQTLSKNKDYNITLSECRYEVNEDMNYDKLYNMSTEDIIDDNEICCDKLRIVKVDDRFRDNILWDGRLLLKNGLDKKEFIEKYNYIAGNGYGKNYLAYKKYFLILKF